ncbi:MAG: glycosyl transferase [Deferribacteraceae bacterium]|jgi:glycosyltransferase involved in cell wall biosynthesis|nr:glycosyl transferase [Deferribacteraceae bacterium]
MRFLQVINVRWYNATAWYAVNLSRILKEHGHEVIVIGLPGSPPIKKAREYGLGVCELNLNTKSPALILKNIKTLNLLINNFKPEVINCHRGEFFWWFAYKRFKSKSFTLIRTRGDQRKPSGDIFNRFIHSKWCDMIVATSKKIKGYFTDVGISENHIKVIYGGVDTKVFHPDKTLRGKIRDEFNFTEDDFVVGIVGRFDPVKGHEVLIRAVAHLFNNENIKNIKLFIVGFDSIIKKTELIDVIKQNGIESIVRFTGIREDICAVMNSFDLGVVSSVGSETICRVGMEIMACGVPLVVSNIGTLPELVEDENVYQYDNHIYLAEKIKKHSKNVRIYSDENFYNEYMKILEQIKKGA